MFCRAIAPDQTYEQGITFMCSENSETPETNRFILNNEGKTNLKQSCQCQVMFPKSKRKKDFYNNNKLKSWSIQNEKLAILNDLYTYKI